MFCECFPDLFETHGIAGFSGTAGLPAPAQPSFPHLANVAGVGLRDWINSRNPGQRPDPVARPLFLGRAA